MYCNLCLQQLEMYAMAIITVEQTVVILFNRTVGQ